MQSFEHTTLLAAVVATGIRAGGEGLDARSAKGLAGRKQDLRSGWADLGGNATNKSNEDQTGHDDG